MTFGMLNVLTIAAIDLVMVNTIESNSLITHWFFPWALLPSGTLS